MTIKEAKEIMQQFRDRQGNSKDDNEALDKAIKALEVVKIIEDAYMSELLKTPMERNVPISDPCDGCQYELNSTNGNPCYSCGKYKLTEQQPCEDCVNREAVAEMLNEMPMKITETWMDFYRKALNSLNKLPPVTPQQTSWIPVSERLPESDEQYHTFLVTDRKGKVTLSEFYLSIKDKKPYWSGMIDVIAWIPLPEPYRTESEDNK